MNYKIRITAENQAIVKRIVDENEMNPYLYTFLNFGIFYNIVDNKFDNIIESDYTEISTEQFVEIFDKKESLVGRWFEALENNTATSQIVKGQFYLIEKEDDNLISFKVPTFEDAEWLFKLNKEVNKNAIKLMPKDFQPTQKSPKVETEWQPKRGDRVLVSNFNDNELEKIFVTKIEGAHYPIVAVHSSSENDFYNNLQFNTSCYKQMKPLPKETDFKTKIIELIEKNINDKQEKLKFVINKNNLIYEAVLECIVAIQKDLLKQIKEL